MAKEKIVWDLRKKNKKKSDVDKNEKQKEDKKETIREVEENGR